MASTVAEDRLHGQRQRQNRAMRFHLRRWGRDRKDRPTLADEDDGWIGAARRPFSDYSVGSLVPIVFDRYARVLHPAWSAPDAPVRWDAVARWSGRTIHALAQWELVSRPLGEARPGCPFVQEPSTGGLPPQQLGLLCEVLATATSTPDRCFIGVWEGYGWRDWADLPAASELRLDQRTFLVHRGSIETAGRIGWQGRTGGFVAEAPTLMWPADRAWLVASDPDLDSTYIGDSEDLIAALLAEPSLEAWPVNPADRVSIDSDAINGMQCSPRL